MSAHEDEFPSSSAGVIVRQPPEGFEFRLCDCSCATQCPHGKTGTEDRCFINVRPDPEPRPEFAGDEQPEKVILNVDYGSGDRNPEPEPLRNRWRVLTQDGNWIEAGGSELRRDEDWIEIVSDGTRHIFHRPQSVEQIR